LYTFNIYGQLKKRVRLEGSLELSAHLPQIVAEGTNGRRGKGEREGGGGGRRGREKADSMP